MWMIVCSHSTHNLDGRRVDRVHSHVTNVKEHNVVPRLEPMHRR